jgi:hypothetical protein
VLQLEEFANGIREILKLGATGLVSLLQVGVFTLFNCGFLTTQDVSIISVPQIGKSPSGGRETSKLGGT